MNTRLWLALGLCLGVSLTPWGPLLLYPFTLFTTWVHGFFLTVLAVQVALNAVFNIRELFLVSGPSDAQTMARLFVVPAWFWAASWMGLSVVLLVSTLRATSGRR